MEEKNQFIDEQNIIDFDWNELMNLEPSNLLSSDCVRNDR